MTTLKDQIACVQRELRMRKGVYPKWVAARRMSQDAADSEIAGMTAVLETLTKLNRQEAEPLFNGSRPR